jgi:hypothetical protein
LVDFSHKLLVGEEEALFKANTVKEVDAERDNLLDV